MKTVTIQEARSQLDHLLGLVAQGQPIELTDDTKPVARLVPVGMAAEEADVDWSDAKRRLESLWDGQSAPGKPASQIIIDDRR